MALVTDISLRVKALLSGASDLGDASATKTLTYGKNLPSGTASGQADQAWADTGQLAASATVDLDLAGSLSGPLGGTLTFVKVKSIHLYADEGNTNNVVVGGAAATQFVGPFGAATHTIAVPPGGMFSITYPTTGWTVAAGSTDFLRLANSGAGSVVNYKILIIGTSA